MDRNICVAGKVNSAQHESYANKLFIFFFSSIDAMAIYDIYEKISVVISFHS